MIAIDTNILIYAHREETPFHETAYKKVETLANGSAAWAIPWPCLHEFFAIATHPRVFDPPTPSASAIDQIEAWLEAPGLQLIAETNHHWPTLSKLARDAQITGPRIHDARIAAICLQHGVYELWTADRDFSAFPALKATNPCI